MKLYTTDTSGNAYKVRLLLSMLNVPYERVMIDAKAGEHKKPPFLKLNPRGQVPVLEDGGHVYWGSTACLMYVARKHGGDSWLPLDPAQMAEIMQWLELAQNELQEFRMRGGFEYRPAPEKTEEGKTVAAVSYSKDEHPKLAITILLKSAKP